MFTPNKYSTALSGLLKLALRALRTCSLSKPIVIISVTMFSYCCPVTSALSAEDSDTVSVALGAVVVVVGGAASGALGASAVVLKIENSDNFQSMLI